MRNCALPSCRRLQPLTAALQPPYSRLTAALQPPYCRLTAALLPPYCRGSTPRCSPLPPPRCTLTALTPGPPSYHHRPRTPPLSPPYHPLHQSPSLRQAAEAAHEARLQEATQELEAELCISEAELRALEAALLASDATHAEQLRQQRRCMLVAVGCLLARRRLVLAPREVGTACAYAPYAAQSAATGLCSEGGWADGRGARCEA
jgi:hypothetical protein